MNDVVAVMKAADFAARKHTNPRRKGEGAEPYLNHLIEVVSLVAEASGGRPEVVVAALLHDVVEDASPRGGEGALFQVASQFNALEMTGPSVTPEDGVTPYQGDHTQGMPTSISQIDRDAENWAGFVPSQGRLAH
jgi:hypothetical protein